MRRSSDRGESAPVARYRVGSPRVRPNVVLASKKTGRRATDDFATTFIVVWQPTPLPPSHWIQLLREAPFGSGKVRARELRWDGKFLSVELMNESDIEAFVVTMPEWVDYANSECGRAENSPAARALKEARRRALEIEERLRR
jgi:hypothetical protein